MKTFQDIFYIKYKLLNKISGTIFILLMVSARSSFAQTSTDDANKIKAIFLFNFTRFIEWPESSFYSPESPFVISVLGGTKEMNNYIEESITGEIVGTHSIIVQHEDNERGPFNCHLLYICTTNYSQIKTALSSLENHNMLTVGESPDFIKLGGIIRFYTQDNKLRLQINTVAAKSAKLNISAKLLNVAKTK